MKTVYMVLPVSSNSIVLHIGKYAKERGRDAYDWGTFVFVKGIAPSSISRSTTGAFSPAG
jgi:hypothetical protein